MDTRIHSSLAIKLGLLFVKLLIINVLEDCAMSEMGPGEFLKYFAGLIAFSIVIYVIVAVTQSATVAIIIAVAILLFVLYASSKGGGSSGGGMDGGHW
jgi:hypothetical protein